VVAGPTPAAIMRTRGKAGPKPYLPPGMRICTDCGGTQPIAEFVRANWRPAYTESNRRTCPSTVENEVVDLTVECFLLGGLRATQGSTISAHPSHICSSY
jgi:hypothetical protein